MDKPFPALIINKKDAINGFTCFGDNVYKKTNIVTPRITTVTEQKYLEIYNECYDEIMNKCTIKKHVYSYINSGQTNYIDSTNKVTSQSSHEIHYCTSCEIVLTENEFINNGLLCDDCLSPYKQVFRT